MLFGSETLLRAKIEARSYLSIPTPALDPKPKTRPLNHESENPRALNRESCPGLVWVTGQACRKGPGELGSQRLDPGSGVSSVEGFVEGLGSRLCLGFRVFCF